MLGPPLRRQLGIFLPRLATPPFTGVGFSTGKGGERLTASLSRQPTLQNDSFNRSPPERCILRPQRVGEYPPRPQRIKGPDFENLRLSPPFQPFRPFDWLSEQRSHHNSAAGSIFPYCRGAVDGEGREGSPQPRLNQNAYCRGSAMPGGLPRPHDAKAHR